MQKQAASTAFLANIPTGHETAEQRSQPALFLPQAALQPAGAAAGSSSFAGSQPGFAPDSIGGGSGGEALPAFQPALCAAPSVEAALAAAAAGTPVAGTALFNPSLQFGGADSTAQLAVPPALALGRGASMDQHSPAAPLTGEMLLYPTTSPMLLHSATAPPSSAASAGILPLRIQTPPPLGMLSASGGAGSGAGGLGAPTGSPASVGAHLFGNPLLFPATLSGPLLDLTRSTTEQLGALHAQHASQQRLLMLAGAGAGGGSSGGNLRATSEYPHPMLAGGLAGSMAPYSTPILSQQNSQQKRAATTPAEEDTMMPVQQQQPQQLPTPIDDSSANALLRTPKPPERPDALGDVESNRTGYRGSPPAVSAAAASMEALPFSTGGSGVASSQQLQPTFLRPDGSGRGLRDNDAFFAPPRALDQSTEEWERDLIQRGILDNARVVVTPQSVNSRSARGTAVHPYGGVGSQAMGAPLWVSSLSPYVPPQHSSSNTSTAPPTPHITHAHHGLLSMPVLNKSRTGSFSLDPATMLLGGNAAMMHGVNASLGGVGDAGDSVLQGGAGKNTMLALVAAAAAAHAAQEAAEGHGEDGSADDGASGGGGHAKKQGTSYAFLLKPRSRGGAAASSDAGSPSAGGAGALMSLAASAGDSGDRSAPLSQLSNPAFCQELLKADSMINRIPLVPQLARETREVLISGLYLARKLSPSLLDEMSLHHWSRMLANTRMVLSPERQRDIHRVLDSSGVLARASRGILTSTAVSDATDALPDSNDLYDPFFLDDPNIRSGKHRVVLHLPGFMSSLISYVRSKELKSELNATFQARHESWLIPSSKMTLSKIRKCKQDVLDIVVSLDLELATASIAWIYFEKLVLRNRVDKASRKIMAAVCLLLAYKWSEGSASGAARKKQVAALFAACEKTLHVPKATMLRFEFPVYVALDFDLGVKPEHVLHHFRQALSKLDTVPMDYRHIQWSL